MPRAHCHWHKIPDSGTAFISVREADKSAAVDLARDPAETGFSWLPRAVLRAIFRVLKIQVRTVNKVKEGRPHIVDMIKNGEIAPIVKPMKVARNSIHEIAASSNALGLLHHHGAGQRHLPCLIVILTKYTVCSNWNGLIYESGTINAAGAGAPERRVEGTKTVKRPAVIEAIAVARDWRPERERRIPCRPGRAGFRRGRIKELESVISNAQIIDASKLPQNGKVVFRANALFDVDLTKK